MKLRPFLAFALLMGAALAGCDSSTSSVDLGDLPDPDPDIGSKLTFTVEHDWTSFGAISQPSVYAAVQDGSSIYAGTMKEGLLYSDDGGATWSQKVFGADAGDLPSNQIYAIAVSGKKVLMGTFDGLSVWDRSVVPGKVTNYLAGKSVYDLWIQGDNLYLAAKDGIYYGALAAPENLARAATSFETSDVLYVFNEKLYAAGQSNNTDKEELNIFNLADFAGTPTKVDVTVDNGQPCGALFVNDRAILVGVDFKTYRSNNGGRHSRAKRRPEAERSRGTPMTGPISTQASTVAIFGPRPTSAKIGTASPFPVTTAVLES